MYIKAERKDIIVSEGLIIRRSVPCPFNICSILSNTALVCCSGVTKEKYSDGVTIKTKCSFDKFGAPLIVLTDDIQPDEQGKNRYGLHFEVVAYEKGCNVWHIVPFPERKERPIKPTKIAFSTFDIPEKSEIDLSVTVKNGKLEIEINGEKLIAESHDLPKEFHIGITACEGINRFSSITIEQ